MSINIKNYRQKTRKYLLKLLESKEICTKECKCCNYEKVLKQKLHESGLFSFNKTIMRWQIDFNSKNYQMFITPLKDE